MTYLTVIKIIIPIQSNVIYYYLVGVERCKTDLICGSIHLLTIYFLE
jgi:hypothetical protein